MTKTLLYSIQSGIDAEKSSIRMRKVFHTVWNSVRLFRSMLGIVLGILAAWVEKVCEIL
ncbi:MAG: hypothetical protein ICV56_05515 [Nitrososphaeraceae archaeon]|nr:hypothetical protein [Nitrososphaeraceae archaeon]